MRILILSHMYPKTYNSIYGIFVHEQVKELLRLGCEVIVISTSPKAFKPLTVLNKKWAGYAQLPYFMEWEGINVIYPKVITWPRNFLKHTSGKRAYNVISKIIKEIYKEFHFDIIHAHSALPDGYVGVNLKRDFNKPLIVTIHGADIYKNLKLNKKCKNAVLSTLRGADTIVAVSNRLRELIIRNDPNLEVKVIPNGVNLEKVVDDNGALLLNEHKNEIVLLSVGYLIERKAHEYVLKSLNKLSKKYHNLKYVIVGDGDRERYLKELTIELGLERNVVFAGRQSHDMVMRYIAGSDIFVLPSWDEAFGVVYVEAMAHGKPIIACEGEGIADFVKDKKTGILVKPKDIESLTNGIEYLVKNPLIAKKIGQSGKELVYSSFTWGNNAKQYLNIYKELTKGSSINNCHENANNAVLDSK